MSFALKSASVLPTSRTVRSRVTSHGPNNTGRAVVVPRRASRAVIAPHAFSFSQGSSGGWDEQSMQDMLRNMAQQFQQASNNSGKGGPSPQDFLQAMAQQFQQANSSSSGGRGTPTPQDILQAMAQQFQQASSSGKGNPFNASSWGPPGININMNSGWGDGWKAAGSSGRRQAPFGSSSGNSPGSSTRPNSSSNGWQRGPLSLALDVVTTEDAYIIYADIPGVTKSDLSIKCSKEQRVLTISGTRPTPTTQQDYRQQQRPFGSFERSWPLPVDADAGGISAKVSDGVLKLTVKKVVKQQDEGEEIFIS